MLALSRDDVRSLVPMRTAVDLMKQVFVELSAGRAQSPLRTPIEVPRHHGVSLFMPAFVPAVDGLGLKVVSVFPENRTHGKPTIHAIVLLVSSATGEPLAILDGTYLTALRTGAVSGAATDLLARPESRVVTCIGAGAQGVTQALAVATVRPIERIYVADLNQDSAASFAQRLDALDSRLSGLVVVADDLQSALQESDVVCTATTSRSPVFEDAWVKDGTHINAIGAFTPEMQEIPATTVARARVVVDAVDAALAEAGDLIMPLESGQVARDHFSVELGQVAAGEIPGRTEPQQVTLFKSVGNAVQDIIVARIAVEQARASGQGQEFSI
jgi:ornithine cyclodeaminase